MRKSCCGSGSWPPAIVTRSAWDSVTHSERCPTPRSIRDLVVANMRRRRLFIVGVCALLWSGPAWAQAQEPPKPLKLYLDCWECDTEYLRQNLLFVDYVRDRVAADIHVFVTTQSTGSGGTSWTLKLIGVGRFQGQD